MVHPSPASAPVTALAVSVDLPSSLVSVAGELDRDSAHHLLDAMAVLTTRTSRRWRLGASAVTFCDAGGVRALSSAHALATAHGRSLDVERTSRQVDRLVELVGHEQVFPSGDDSADHDSPAGTTDGATPARRASSTANARLIRCGTTGTA